MNLYDLKKKLTPDVALTLPWGYIHVYYHSSQTSLLVQVNLIITLSLGSMVTDRVIGEPCYNKVIYNRHIAK